jgi:hypothetical protein
LLANLPNAEFLSKTRVMLLAEPEITSQIKAIQIQAKSNSPLLENQNIKQKQTSKTTN